MKHPAKLIMGILGTAAAMAAFPATEAVAGDRDAAALFTSVCVANVPAFKRVQNIARSEGWMKGPVGHPKPARLEAWLVPVGDKVGFVVSVSTVKTTDQTIEQCTVGGPSSRQAVRAMLQSVKADEQQSMTGRMVPGGIGGNPRVYTAQLGDRIAYITVEAGSDAYVLSITIPHQK